jgi:membrane-associated phospholipid phosphatase
VGDGSEIPEVSFGEGGRVATGDVAVFGRRINSGSTEFGDWTPDPNTPATSPEATLALGASWGAVKPFVLNSGAQFRPALPAPFDAPNGNGLDRYIDSLLNVATMGGSPDNTGILSTSTEEFRFVGNFWGYDGVPLIGVPPRLYNQIAVQLTEGRVSDPLEVARILALINVGLADAGIAAWDAKYFYNFWRPVTAVRAPTTLSPLIPRDENWDPVGVSVVNTDLAIRPSPPFPAYPSGHATFGATTFEILRDFFGDNTPFTFVSDEFNGEGFDPLTGLPRPLVPVRFSTLTEAQEENGISRIYNGSHWDFDDTVGQAMGVSVARFLLDNSQVLKRL